MKKLLFSTLAMTLILFLWNGVTQLFPWGVPTAQTISTQREVQTDSFQTPNLIEMEAGSLTTDQFDEVFNGKISTLTTDRTFSWIVTAPIENYDPMGYFVWEFITQFFVAIFLSFLLIRLGSQKLNHKIIIVALAGILAFFGIYGQMLNWWAMPALYAIGAGANLIIGWVLATYATGKWIIKG